MTADKKNENVSSGGEVSATESAAVTRAVEGAREALRTIQRSLPHEEGFGIGLSHQYYAQALRAAAMLRELKTSGALPPGAAASLPETLELSTGALQETFATLSRLAEETTLSTQQGTGPLDKLHKAMGQLTALSAREPDPVITQALMRLEQAHDIIATHGLNRMYPKERLYADRDVEDRMHDVYAGVGGTSFTTVNFDTFLLSAQPLGKAVRLIEETRDSLTRNGLAPGVVALLPAAPEKVAPRVGASDLIIPAAFEVVESPIHDARLTNERGDGLLDRLKQYRDTLAQVLEAHSVQVNSEDVKRSAYLEHQYMQSRAGGAFLRERNQLDPKAVVHQELQTVLSHLNKAYALLEAYAINKEYPSRRKLIDDDARQLMEDIRMSVDEKTFEKNYDKYLAVAQPVGQSHRLLEECRNIILHLVDEHKPSTELARRLAPKKGGQDISYRKALRLKTQEWLEQHGLPKSLADTLLRIEKMSIENREEFSLRGYLNSQHRVTYEDIQEACRQACNFIRKHKKDADDLRCADWLDPDGAQFNPARARAQSAGGYSEIGQELSDIIRYTLDLDFHISVRDARELAKTLPELQPCVSQLMSAYEGVLALDLHATYPEWAIPADTLPAGEIVRTMDKAVTGIMAVAQSAGDGPHAEKLTALKEQLIGSGYSYKIRRETTSHPPLRAQVEAFLQPRLGLGAAR